MEDVMYRRYYNSYNNYYPYYRNMATFYSPYRQLPQNINNEEINDTNETNNINELDNNNRINFENEVKFNNTNNSKNENNQTREQDKTESKINENKEDENDSSRKEDSEDTFRWGPITIEDARLSAFGFSLPIDDIVIIGILFFLVYETSRDYILIIVLGLIFFNISFSSIGSIVNLDFLRNLNIFG